MMKPKVLLCAVALWSAAAFALPSTEAVQEAVRAGNYPQAETMMKEVVAAKPQSAKAHYVYAEILAHEARFAEAATQARLAREADPQITFTDPQQFRHFEQTLQREQSSSTGTTPVTPDRAAQHPATNEPAAPPADPRPGPGPPPPPGALRGPARLGVGPWHRRDLLLHLAQGVAPRDE